MVERLGEMRKGRGQKIEKGSRERKDPTLRCSHCYFKSSGYDKHKNLVFTSLWNALLNKTLGRALDPRANGTWLSKLTE